MAELQPQKQRVPVFPLNTLLFPGCRLPLQIFEQRYLNMLSTCLKQGRGFVIVLIRKGSELGVSPDIFSVGTLVQVIDWQQQSNGVLGITVEGIRRVALHDLEVLEDGLLTATMRYLDEIQIQQNWPTEPLIALLDTLVEHPLVKQLGVNADHGDINSLIWCLTGLLPFSNLEKQHMLELEEVEHRRQELNRLLESLS